MKSFSSLSEREVLGVAISSEEEAGRIYMAFAEDLKDRYPDTATVFEQMAEEERGHRHRLLEMYESRFGKDLPPIRREDVSGLLRRRPIWLTKNLPLDTIRKEVESIEHEAAQFYSRAAEQRRTSTSVACSAISPKREGARKPRRETGRPNTQSR